MFEFGVRVVLSAGVVFVASAFGYVPFELAWKVALCQVLFAAFITRLEEKGFRNQGTAGFIAAADSLAISVILAGANCLGMLAFLVLVPIADAVRRFGSNTLYMTPLAAASILGSQAMFFGTNIPPAGVLLQTCGVLCVGFLISRATVVIPEEEPVIEQAKVEQSDGFLELREKYRNLREAYVELESKSKQDRVSALLGSCRDIAGSGYFTSLAGKIADLGGVNSAVLYTVAGYDSSLVVRATHGDIPEASATAGLDVDVREATTRLRSDSERAVAALRSDGDFANVPLLFGGKVIGLVSLSADNPSSVQGARHVVEDAAPIIAGLVSEGLRREDSDRRLREAELLYDLASLEGGAHSTLEIGRRFVADIREALQADHVAIWLLEGDEVVCLAREGRDLRILEEMSFAAGHGVNGWVKSGAPDLNLCDVRTDSRFPTSLGLRHRIGSFFASPIGDGKHIEGFVTVVTDRVGGLDLGASPIMSTACHELGHALFRAKGLHGIMNPGQFKSAMNGQSGAIVILDPIRRDEIASQHGKPAYTHMLRKLTRRIRTMLPTDASLCRRPTGDFIAFLPNVAEQFATSWANEAVAAATMMDIRTPDGSVRIPVVLRAKVAVIDPQNDQLSAELTA